MATTATSVSAAMSCLLVLADSRLPAGAHAHSGGVEQAISARLVRDTATLEWFVRRRLATAGLTAAAAAAFACRAAHDPVQLGAVDTAIDVATASAALREASRTQGRGLLRLARRMVPDLPAPGRRPHQPVVLGALAARLGIDGPSAALLSCQLTVSGITGAAQRLLALDPLDVADLLVRLGDDVARTAETAAAATELPDGCDPLADLLAETHRIREDRYFVS